MKFAQLRRTLHRIALASLPALALAACDDAPAVGPDAMPVRNGHLSTTASVIQPADPFRQQLINACAAGDQQSCLRMCQELLCGQTGFQDVFSCSLEREGNLATFTIRYDGTESCAVPGRRPAGLTLPRELVAASPAGAWLARATQLEAASVYAFVALARELRHHGAPASLVRAAVRAAEDEAAHAQLMGRLAARYRTDVAPVEVTLPPVRSLEAIAYENAIEGCVHETWAALVAIYQAKAAQDPEVRAVMGRIAADELRHAALAWAVDRWLSPQLDTGVYQQIERARLAAAAALAEEIAQPRAFELVTALGLPDVARGHRLLGDLRAAVWT
jgi:hypothetical protein